METIRDNFSKYLIFKRKRTLKEFLLSIINKKYRKKNMKEKNLRQYFISKYEKFPVNYTKLFKVL